uniref:G-protein coupled receptors family 2 profile 1 domain-containing protein n=1 Tax=Cyclopterus lumpus TaxID=8103 RepID=A0A8C3G228_CYCLU
MSIRAETTSSLFTLHNGFFPLSLTSYVMLSPQRRVVGGALQLFPFSFQGTFCRRMWDGLLCWDETPAGTSVTQNCPDHPDLDPTQKATKYCEADGEWFYHPESKRIWTNYTLCATTHEKRLRVMYF